MHDFTVITHLAAAKDYPNQADTLNTMLIFTDRANRKWGWVKFADDGNSGTSCARWRTRASTPSW